MHYIMRHKIFYYYAADNQEKFRLHSIGIGMQMIYDSTNTHSVKGKDRERRMLERIGMKKEKIVFTVWGGIPEKWPGIPPNRGVYL